MKLFNHKISFNKIDSLFLIISIFFLIPILSIFALAFQTEENIWPHLYETVFPLYLKNSLILILGVAFFSFIFGVVSAWVITMYDFPTKKILCWAILLPFAFPAYIIFYIYTNLLEYSGPVQVLMRAIFNGQENVHWFPEIRSLPGAIFLFSLVLYPYVHLLTRKAFLEQSTSILESAQMLGYNKWQSFFKISLPLARPAIVVGLILVMMETLSDFGGVDFFSISTLSLGVYNVWINMGNLGGASQIALFTLMVVFLLITLERFQRNRQKQIQNENSIKTIPLLKGVKMIVVLMFNWGLIALGFIIPLLVLLKYFIREYKTLSFNELFNLIQNSFLLSSFSVICTVSGGIVIVYFMRFYHSSMIKIFSKLFFLNYAIPGIIMAIGIMIPFNFFSSSLFSFLESTLNYNPKILIYLPLFSIVLAYIFRFIPIPIGSIDSTFKKTSINLDMSASLLGLSNFKIFTKLHFPLIKKALFTAALIVFVDSMKELPITLILRPFNFETLATNVYSFANSEMIEKASASALFIVLIGILPTIYLSRNIDN